LTEGAGNGFDCLQARSLVGDVASNSDMTVAKVLRGGLCGGPIDVEDGYPSALFGKPSGGREANPAGRSRTCNNGCFAAKQHSILPVSILPRRCGRQPVLLIPLLGPRRFRDKRAVVGYVNLVHSSTCCYRASRFRLSEPSKRLRAPAP